MFKYILLFIFFFSSPCFAKTLSLEYIVYAGGLKALKAKMEVNYLNDNSFKINSVAETIGFFKVLYPVILNYETRGEIKNNQPKTLSYEYTVKVRSKKRKKEVDISKSSSPDVFVDYQTALLKTMHELALSNECNNKNIVFAKNKTLEISFNDTKKEIIEKKEYGIFEGNATTCNISVKNLGENDENDWFFGQSDGKLKAYFADALKSKDFLLVKANMGTIGYGLIIAYLVKADVKN